MTSFFHTDDGGKTWITQYDEPAGKYTDLFDGLQDVYFINPQVGWVAGQTTEFGGTCLVLRTTDGGKTWMEKTLTIDPDALAVLDRNRAAVITEANRVVLTRDGGKTWTEQILSPRRYSWHFSEIFASQTGR